MILACAAEPPAGDANTWRLNSPFTPFREEAIISPEKIPPNGSLSLIYPNAIWLKKWAPHTMGESDGGEGVRIGHVLRRCVGALTRASAAAVGVRAICPRTPRMTEQ